MATVAVAKQSAQDPDLAYIWETLTTTNQDGASIEIPGKADISVQVIGTFGVGGTLTMQGSNNDVDFATLTDPQGNAIAFTAAGIEQILEKTRFIRPLESSGDGITDLDVLIYVRAP